jgi:hypothetical protein
VSLLSPFVFLFHSKCQFLTKRELKEIEKATNYSREELREIHFQYAFDSTNELTQEQLEKVLAER